METLMFVLAQVFGVFSLISFVVSTRFNKHGQVLIWRTVTNIFAILQYLCLGAFSAVLINVVGILRNVIFRRRKRKHIWAFVIVFLALEAVSGVICFDGVESLLVVLHSMIFTIYIGQENLTKYRISQIIAMPIIVFYNIFVGAYVGIIENLVQLASLVVSVLKFDRKKLKKIKNKV